MTPTAQIIRNVAQKMTREQWHDLRSTQRSTVTLLDAGLLLRFVMDLATNLTSDEREWLLYDGHDVQPADAPCIPGLVAKGLVRITLGEPIVVHLGQEVVWILENCEP